MPLIGMSDSKSVGIRIGDVQNKTLEVIRSLVSEESFRLGALSKKTGRFVAWKGALDHSMKKISQVYVRHYDEPKRWMFAALLDSRTRANSSHERAKRKT